MVNWVENRELTFVWKTLESPLTLLTLLNQDKDVAQFTLSFEMEGLINITMIIPMYPISIEW